jgi:GxxExxY protein
VSLAEQDMQTRSLNDISYLIIQSAIQVHRELGPGLLESVYRACLSYELRQRSLAVIAEQLLPIRYRGVIIEGAYRLDLLVEDQVIVEVKAIEKVLPVHSAQLLSYLRLLNKPLGLLINFHVPVLIAGVDRVMNGHHADALRTKTPSPPDQQNQKI